MNGRQISEPKGFQRATAEAALAAFSSGSGPRRFLIADEVGLGKTVVARTIMAEMMKKKRTPLVVFYVASNLNIAHQNRAKLLEAVSTVDEEVQAAARVDRLTLAANPATRPTHSRLHLYTLTPDTSIPLFRRRGGFGRLEERALIYRLLVGRYPSLDTAEFRQYCRGGQASEAGWRWALSQQEKVQRIRELQEAFLDSLSRDKALGLAATDSSSIAEVIEQRKRSRVMGSFRTALALAALREVQPDLIIFDEFQKFRDLLIDPNPKAGVPASTTDPLTLAFRGGSKASDPAVLLLSATPYRPYSSRQEEREGFSHHREFFELIRFLFGPETNEPKGVELALKEYGQQMLSPSPDLPRLTSLKVEIERRLIPVMSRTERNDLNHSSARTDHPSSDIRSEDIRVFKSFVERLKNSRQGKRRHIDLTSYAVPYWLSVPYPVQMLGRNYLAWRLADRRRPMRSEPALRKSQRDRLNAPAVLPHGQLRTLSKLAPSPRLALPWIAPSIPWWELGGLWADRESAGGKLLIFSRFKAAPTALASLLSFNLEANFASRLKRDYRLAGKSQPLQFKDDRPTLPALFFPSPTIIKFTDPRLGSAASLVEVKASLRKQVRSLLSEKLGFKIRRRGGCRALWKLLSFVEYRRASYLPELELPDWEDLGADWRTVAGEQRKIMTQVFNKWSDFAWQGVDSLTESEVAALAEFALSGPGIVLGRALYRYDPTCLNRDHYSELLDASWNGLRSYLNRSLFQAALTRRSQKYTQAIPEAIVAGNLESVLDEHLWISSKLDAGAIPQFCANLKKVLGLRDGRHQVHESGSDGFHLRCHAAMPFADAKVARAGDKRGDRLRTDDLRKAFNSPFWPHVLATTSLGQEGLDFHVWCRQLLHWDLCSSPLDLEQREGRIQRFGGLSVRRALAELHHARALSAAQEFCSPWRALARIADEESSTDPSGRSPWWSCQGERIDRLFVVLPNSRQTARFDRLSDQRWHYRLALGQPHQQDFIETISQLPHDGRQTRTLCLSAWKDNRNRPE